MLSRIVARLMRQWQESTADERSLGAAWYRDARAACAGMAREHDCTIARAAGIVAALSPRLKWSANVRAARACLARALVRGVFRANLAKAEAIRDGGRPLDVLRGPKVRAFYRALTGDESHAVIDVWMLRAVHWTRALTDRAYAMLARALARAASLVGTSVARFQAAVWTHVRGRAT